MSEEPSKEAVIAGGLLAIKPGAGRYYRSFQNHTGGKLVLPRWGGVGHFRETYRHYESDADEASDGGKRLVLFGHSLGALLSVMYAATHDNVESLMLLGMPRLGTAQCRLGPLGPAARKVIPVIEALAPNSPLLGEINEHLTAVVDRVTCVHARFDLIVWPARSCFIPGARREVYLPWANHMSMINHQDVLDEADHLLGRPQLAAAA